MRNPRTIFKQAATLILMTGLAYSQVCNVLCSFVGNPSSVEVVQPLQSEENSHCHHRQSSEQKSQPEPERDQKPAGSHDCPSHKWARSLPSETLKSIELLQKQLQVAVIVPGIFSLPLSNHRTGEAVDDIQFHPPPQKPLRSILRI
jgi:hypothetical protein